MVQHRERLRSVGTAEAVALWSIFLESMGLSAQTATRLWRDLQGSSNAKVKALLFEFDRLAGQLGVRSG
jgi:hypothetical protein